MDGDMVQSVLQAVDRYLSLVQSILTNPRFAAVIPMVCLSAFWIGGEGALVAVAIVVPTSVVICNAFSHRRDTLPTADPVTGLLCRDDAVADTELALKENPVRAGMIAALAVEIDEFTEVDVRHGQSAGHTIQRACAERLRSVVREHDVVFRLQGARMGVILFSSAMADLESLIQLSNRIQQRIQEPISLDGTRIFVSASVGFCAPGRAPSQSAEAVVGAAEQALEDATSNGTGAIRAFTLDMRRRARNRGVLSDDLPKALEEKQIKPWFQPQVDAETGDVTGFEVLARWDHPQSGLVPPGEFLPAAEHLGLLGRLGETMLYQSLNALRAWDATGSDVPNVSLNFSSEELRNPTIVEQVRWELDRFDIAPDRLNVEVLETVIAQTSNDTIIRNLRAFSEMGCRIDLDDFGTGHASIANIKRFSVDRIKVDRSFVTQIDSDADQQNIVAAILTLAERMQLDTLAEGVETPAEHAVLRRLGCRHIQGYGIARPMPFDDVGPWLARYRSRATKDTTGPAARSADNARPAPGPRGKTA